MPVRRQLFEISGLWLRLYAHAVLMTPSNVVHKLLAWYAQSARPLPWRRTRDPYAIWVSEVMLQQTQVKTVLPYWERWMRELPTIKALAAAKPQKLHKLWEGLGYYTRVRNLQRAARIVWSQHDGRFPRDFEDVLALPGIGRYTAGAICSIAFNQPRPLLDGNVMRVLARLYGIGGDPRAGRANARLWQLAEALVTTAAGSGKPRACSHFNQSLMELGALVCTPKQPQCGACPVSESCIARRQGRAEQLPRRRRHPAPVARSFAAFVAQKGNLFLVRQRPAGVVNAHLWEFPNVELVAEDADLKRAAREALGARATELRHFATVKHSITRYRITLKAYQIAGPRGAELKGIRGRWLSKQALARLPLTSAHKRILQSLGSPP
jgi:A/G-specific adenine glycosylase